MVEEKNEERKKHPGGRPLKFKTPEELEQKIQAYFDYCDNYTREVITKTGKVIKVKDPLPYTVSGLAVFLDTTRDLLIDYEDKDKFSDAIKRAKARCLADAERRLYQDFTPGVIFSMKNNYKWSDKQEIEQTGEITITVSDQAQKWGK